MPRDGSGTYTLPAGSAAVSGTTISSTKFNALINDLESDANTARPVSAGGTGAASETAARNAFDVAARSGTETISGAWTFSGNPVFSGSPDFSGVGNASTIRTDLGLEIGADVQAYDAGLSPTPVGTVILFAGTSAPTGYLKLNGAELSRTTYAALFAHLDGLGLAGPGDGSTTFDLPDYRAEFPRFWDDSRGVDTGRTIGSAQLDALQGHQHTLTYVSQLGGGGGGYNLQGGGSNYTTNGIVTDGTNGTPRVAGETRPRNVALLACIKY